MSILGWHAVEAGNMIVCTFWTGKTRIQRFLLPQGPLYRSPNKNAKEGMKDTALCHEGSFMYAFICFGNLNIIALNIFTFRYIHEDYT